MNSAQTVLPYARSQKIEFLVGWRRHERAWRRMERKEKLQQEMGTGWIALNVWLDRLGRSETTGYRWRKRGWLKTTIIAGKHYLSPANLAEFERRAAAGEFTKVSIPPCPLGLQPDAHPKG